MKNCTSTTGLKNTKEQTKLKTRDNHVTKRCALKKCIYLYFMLSLHLLQLI